MADLVPSRQCIPLSPEFFCDGHFYVLTSSSLGGSQLTPSELADRLGRGEPAEMTELLAQGVCLPLFFDGDCALDSETLIVLGDLTEPEAQNWIGRLVGRVNIPCGKLVILCGGGDADELAAAISGHPPEPDYTIFQVIDVPPNDYQVELYAYLSSMTVQVYLADRPDLEKWYATRYPAQPSVGYVIRLTPLTTELSLPRLVEEMGWCGDFDFRPPES